MPMLGDESELHRASLAKNAAAFFRMSRSARSLAFSLRSRSISSCSGFSWPWPGKACIGSALSSFAQRRSMFSSIYTSRAACATLTPRSRISRTASTLNSRANTRLPMGHLQLQQSPFLGVHETGSRPLATAAAETGRQIGALAAMKAKWVTVPFGDTDVAKSDAGKADEKAAQDYG